MERDIKEKIMLKTPLGDIIIKRNGKEIDFVAEWKEVDQSMQLPGMTAQSYQIDVDFEEGDDVACLLNKNPHVQQGDSAMGICACKMFFSDLSFLTIGCMEEINGCPFDGNSVSNGIAYNNLKKGEVPKVVFAISWIER